MDFTGPILLVVIVGIILATVVFFHFIPLGLWITAFASNVRVSLFQLFGMRFRKVDPKRIVQPLIAASKAGLDLDVNDLESLYLAKGNVDRVVDALISADKAGIGLDFRQASAIDLAGRDVF